MDYHEQVNDDEVQIELQYVHQTPKAVLFNLTGDWSHRTGQVWIPKSVIHAIGQGPGIGCSQLVEGETYEILIARWFAEQEELE